MPPQAAPPPANYYTPQPQAVPQQHQAYPQQHYGYQQPAPKGFLGEVYSNAFGFLFKKPIHLWGLSVLCSLLTILAVLFGFLPIIWLPVVLVLELGMANIFLRGYRGHTISSALLFEGFSKKFARNAGGMGWRMLWLLIWALIPIAGIVIAVVKFYSYRFVPYIMLTEPDIQATEALKKSIAQTKGYKGKMFLADFLIGLAVGVATGIFALIALIPFIGIVLFVIYYILLVALLPLLIGILEAIYYDKISKENPIN